MFTRKVILGILVVSLLGSVTLAYGLSTEFLFKFDSGVGPTSSTSNSTHIFIATFDKIEIFDISGTFVHSFDPTIPSGSSTPFAVAVNSTYIFVTGSFGTSNIDLFDLSGTFDSTFSGDLTKPRGITLNSTHVFVVDGSTDRVEIFNLSGTIVGSATNNLGDPIDVATDSNGRIIVTDNADDRIEIFDSSGNYLDSYGIGEFTNPNGVDVDSNDRIIVSDGANGNVKIFDSSGSLLTTFGDEEITTPSGLAVDSNDRIIVPDSSKGDVKVFAYGGGGGNDEFKTAPTSGKDWKTEVQVVEGGFMMNGQSYDLTDNWHTDFESKKVMTGIPNTFSAKTYAQNNGLMIQEFAFGIPEIGEYHNAETLIEVHYDYDKTIKETKIVQNSGAIRESSVTATTSQVDCNANSSMKCYKTDLEFIFDEPLKNDVMAIKAIDLSRRTMMPTYLNEGIDVFGDLLTPSKTMQVIGTEKYEGLITITQTEKFSNLWIAEDGRLFDSQQNFKHVNPSYDRGYDSGLVNSRNHMAYNLTVKAEETRASEYLNDLYGNIYKDLPESITYDYSEIDSRTQFLIDHGLLNQVRR